MEKSIVLASGSPRRAELLNQIGIAFSVYPVSVDESSVSNESPEEYCTRLARLKASMASRLISEDLSDSSASPGLVVIGADTVVCSSGQFLSKPKDSDDARRMLSMLSGRWHSVYTGVDLCSPVAGGIETFSVRTDVLFRRISEDETQRYIETGEPMDKAGAYGIQGQAAVFVKEIRGSYTGVVGLPLFETAEALRRFGILIP